MIADNLWYFNVAFWSALLLYLLFDHGKDDQDKDGHPKESRNNDNHDKDSHDKENNN